MVLYKFSNFNWSDFYIIQLCIYVVIQSSNSTNTIAFVNSKTQSCKFGETEKYKQLY